MKTAGITLLVLIGLAGVAFAAYYFYKRHLAFTAWAGCQSNANCDVKEFAVSDYMEMEISLLKRIVAELK